MTEQTHAEQQIVVEIIENIFMLKKKIKFYISSIRVQISSMSASLVQ